jgi:group I intron endonuclease
MYYIYKHTSPSGKSYIGQTTNVARRIREHRSSNNCRAFHNAIQKYGWELFSTEILAIVQTIAESNELETKYITEHNTLTPNGYNLKLGGDNKIISEYTRKLISIAKQGDKNPQFGKEPWNKGLTKETSSIIQEKINRWLEHY